MSGFSWTWPRGGSARRRGRPILAFAAAAVVSAVLTGCDTASEHVSVENQCGEALTIAIVESNSPNADDYARDEATAYGEVVAPGSSTESYLMEAAGGFVVDALAADGSVYTQWRSFKDPERSFILSTDTGTCPS